MTRLHRYACPITYLHASLQTWQSTQQRRHQPIVDCQVPIKSFLAIACFYEFQSNSRYLKSGYLRITDIKQILEHFDDCHYSAVTIKISGIRALPSYAGVVNQSQRLFRCIQEAELQHPTHTLPTWWRAVLDIYHYDKNYLELQKPLLGKFYFLCFEFLVRPMTYLKSLRSKCLASCNAQWGQLRGFMTTVNYLITVRLYWILILTLDGISPTSNV